MRQLQERAQVVTGGSSGIGLARAKRPEQEAAKVIISGRSEKALEQAVKTVGNGAPTIEADVYFVKLWLGV
jgi:short-subunit dehydrogenase involved in D-alanine esterification of teichoic acids